MALSEESKQFLSPPEFQLRLEIMEGLTGMNRSEVLKELGRLGPARILDSIIGSCLTDNPEFQAINQNIKENRKEAEQILAGLLGMT